MRRAEPERAAVVCALEQKPHGIATLEDIDVDGKRVFVRADLNVPLDAGGQIADDARIRAALPTIEALRSRGAAIVLASHLGRPTDRDPALSLAPVAARVAELTGAKVTMAPDVVGPTVRALSERLAPGEILVLENLRYEPGETHDDPALAAELAALADFYVNDAFGTAHRAHASTEGIAHCLPSAAGLLLERELKVLGELVENPQRPMVAVLGGAKVADKIGVVNRFLQIADTVLVGGALALPFLAAKGHGLGASPCAPEDLAAARSALDAATSSSCQLMLPSDLIVADSSGASRKLDGVDVPDGARALDIGLRTAADFELAIIAARTVFWNGPMGRFEDDAFAAGTLGVALAIAECRGLTVVGGGETNEAVHRLGLEHRMTHCSTGGGAALELLAGHELPGVQALRRAA